MFLPRAQETGDGKAESLKSDPEEFSIFYLAPYTLLLVRETGGNLLEQSKVICFAVKLEIRALWKAFLELGSKTGKCQKSSASPKTQTADLLPHKSRGMCGVQRRRLDDNKISPFSICSLSSTPPTLMRGGTAVKMDTNSGVKSFDSKNCGP